MPPLESLFISFEMINGSLGCRVKFELCISKTVNSFEGVKEKSNGTIQVCDIFHCGLKLGR